MYLVPLKNLFEDDLEVCLESLTSLIQKGEQKCGKKSCLQMKTKWIEGEICVKAPCAEEEEEKERAPEIKSNLEALQTAEKFLEYSRSKGNERHSLVLSKSTNLLQEIVLQNQKQATIHVFFGKYCEDTKIL